MTGEMVTFIVVAVLLVISPGPDTFLVLRNTMRGGRGDGIATSAGIILGLVVHASLSAFGVSLLLVNSAALFNALKTAGALYLVWLGIKSLVSAWQRGDAPSLAGAGAQTEAQSFREGFYSNLLNPKVAVFYLAFLPQFIRPGSAAALQSFLLAAIHIVVSLVWLLAICLLVHTLRRLILRPAVRRALDGVSGMVLIGLGLRLALERR